MNLFIRSLLALWYITCFFFLLPTWKVFNYFNTNSSNLMTLMCKVPRRLASYRSFKVFIVKHWRAGVFVVLIFYGSMLRIRNCFDVCGTVFELSTTAHWKWLNGHNVGVFGSIAFRFRILREGLLVSRGPHNDLEVLLDPHNGQKVSPGPRDGSEVLPGRCDDPVVFFGIA